jgi:hypothetical protein
MVLGKAFSRLDCSWQSNITFHSFYGLRTFCEWNSFLLQIAWKFASSSSTLMYNLSCRRFVMKFASSRSRVVLGADRGIIQPLFSQLLEGSFTRGYVMVAHRLLYTVEASRERG